MRSLTSRVGRSWFADLPDMLPATGDIAFPPGRDHGACSFVANQQVWVQQIFGGRPDSKRGLSRSFTSSKLQFLRFYSYLTCVACCDRRPSPLYGQNERLSLRAPPRRGSFYLTRLIQLSGPCPRSRLTGASSAADRCWAGCAPRWLHRFRKIARRPSGRRTPARCPRSARWRAQSRQWRQYSPA